MELRTRINIERSKSRVTYTDPVFLIGSCFASEIGSKLVEGKMPVMINPAGTVYNPVSVVNSLDSIMSGKKVTIDDLFCHEGSWLSFSHCTDFSSDDPDIVIEKVNHSSALALEFLKRARYLFITFGTARVFRLRDTGAIVSNCHKLPSSFFDRELLKTDEIISLWNDRLTRISEHFPGLKVIFTISPVRHWKDGAHGNQVSKSVLFLAVEELLSHPSEPEYFPAYEILMDELRDYRFYSDDMLHPSTTAVEYIWEAFSGSYIDNQTMSVWKEVAGISRAMKHRVTSSDPKKIREFAKSMLTRIDAINPNYGINLTEERIYFLKLGI